MVSTCVARYGNFMCHGETQQQKCSSPKSRGNVWTMVLLITRACYGGSKPNVVKPALHPASPTQIMHVSVEGWRDIQHSYAVVNQFQLLELIKRPDVRVSVRDMPYYRPWWRKTSGLFNAEQAAALACRWQRVTRQQLWRAGGSE